MADYQKWFSKFDSENIRIFAASVDLFEDANEVVEKNSLTFPVAYGVDAEEISKLTGAFYNDDKKYVNATGFLLRPDHTIDVACYSTNNLGRLTARDVFAVIRYYKKTQANLLKTI